MDEPGEVILEVVEHAHHSAVLVFGSKRLVANVIQCDIDLCSIVQIASGHHIDQMVLDIIHLTGKGDLLKISLWPSLPPYLKKHFLGEHGSKGPITHSVNTLRLERETVSIGGEDQHLCTIERAEMFVKVVLLQACTRVGGGPQLHGVGGDSEGDSVGQVEHCCQQHDERDQPHPNKYDDGPELRHKAAPVVKHSLDPVLQMSARNIARREEAASGRLSNQVFKVVSIDASHTTGGGIIVVVAQRSITPGGRGSTQSTQPEPTKHDNPAKDHGQSKDEH